MKCHFCDAMALIIFADWPEDLEYGLCEAHCTDTNLHKIHSLLRKRGGQAVTVQDSDLLKMAS